MPASMKSNGLNAIVPTHLIRISMILLSLRRRDQWNLVMVWVLHVFHLSKICLHIYSDAESLKERINIRMKNIATLCR